jgi:hypothetical protein
MQAYPKSRLLMGFHHVNTLTHDVARKSFGKNDVTVVRD